MSVTVPVPLLTSSVHGVPEGHTPTECTSTVAPGRQVLQVVTPRTRQVGVNVPGPVGGERPDTDALEERRPTTGLPRPVLLETVVFSV